MIESFIENPVLIPGFKNNNFKGRIIAKKRKGKYKYTSYGRRMVGRIIREYKKNKFT